MARRKKSATTTEISGYVIKLIDNESGATSFLADPKTNNKGYFKSYDEAVNVAEAFKERIKINNYSFTIFYDSKIINEGENQ